MLSASEIDERAPTLATPLSRKSIIHHRPIYVYVVLYAKLLVWNTFAGSYLIIWSQPLDVNNKRVCWWVWHKFSNVLRTQHSRKMHICLFGLIGTRQSTRNRFQSLRISTIKTTLDAIMSYFVPDKWSDKTKWCLGNWWSSNRQQFGMGAWQYPRICYNSLQQSNSSEV